jgi:putative nucleotidyltransferase with HDIG domain
VNSCALVVSENPSDPQSYQRRLGDGWDVNEICSPKDVIAALSGRRFDLILLDGQSEISSDAGFLDSMKKAAPQAIPVVFETNEAFDYRVRTRIPREGIGECVRCEESFLDQVSRECLVARLYGDECTRRIQPLITRTPTQRGIYHRVVEEVNSPHGSLERVAEFIANDPMLTARVLQMVNSAALGLRRRFVDANEAVIMLGGERIKSMIVFVEVFSICEKFRFIKFSPEKLWRHSLLVGRIAREIMRTRSRAGVDADASFTGGLLHDVGKLLLAINLPDRYREVLEDLEDDPLGDAWASEVKFLQTSHAEVGAMILESWNLPYSIVEAVGYHHSPNRLSKDGFTPLDAVAVANAIVHERQIPSTEEAALVRTPMNRKIWERWGEEQMADWSQDFLDSN